MKVLWLPRKSTKHPESAAAMVLCAYCAPYQKGNEMSSRTGIPILLTLYNLIDAHEIQTDV